MQAFKNFFRLFWSIRGLVMVYMAVFLTLTGVLISVGASEKSTPGFEGTSLKIGVVDKDESTYSKAMIAYLSEGNEVEQIEDDREQILEDIYWRERDYVLVIPKGFEAAFVDEKVDDLSLESMCAPGIYDAEFGEAQIQLYNSKLKLLLETGVSLEEAVKEVEALNDKKADVEMASFVKSDVNDGVIQFFRYVPYLFLAVSVIAIGEILIIINKKEVKERVECSSMPLSNRVWGILAAIICFGLILMALVVIYGTILTHGKLLSDSGLAYYLLNSLAMLLFSLGLAFFAGNVVNSKEGVNGIVNVSSLALCFLGGVFVPQEFFGEGVKQVAQFMPTYWFVKNNELIGSTKNYGGEFLQQFGIHMGIMLLFAVCMFAITFVVINMKRKRKA